VPCPIDHSHQAITVVTLRGGWVPPGFFTDQLCRIEYKPIISKQTRFLSYELAWPDKRKQSKRTFSTTTMHENKT